jgi:hypothetical protein
MCRWLICTLLSVAVAQSSDKARDVTAHRPDGTPIFPLELRQVLRDALAAGRGVSDRIRKQVLEDDLQAFTDAMQVYNYEQMFASDGSAVDIEAWRQMFREDEVYSQLFLENFPEKWQLIMSGTDEEVQAMFRAQHVAAHRAAQAKFEL